jgi:ribonuclease HI
MKIKLFTDGAARGNPGPAAIGVVLYNENDEVLEQHCRYLGTATNNMAEYEALLAGLELAKKYLPCGVHVHMDSELVVKQMLGSYRVKNEHLIGYFQKANRLKSHFDTVSFTHIPREMNKLADRLANQALDSVGTAKSGNQ